MRESGTNMTIKQRCLFVAALIGLGFLWSGTAYMMQVYRLLNFFDGGTVNLLACGLYYVCQAGGVGIVAFLFAKRPVIAGGRALPFYTSIAMVACSGIAMFSPSAGVVVAAGALLNLMIGALSALYLTRLSTHVPQRRRGLVFGVAYAFGSLGTWLISLPMDGKFLWSSESFFAVAALAAASLPLLRRLSALSGQHNDKPPRQGLSKKLMWLAAAVIFLIWLKNTLGFSFPLKSAAGGVQIEFTRSFYAVGLIIAGLISDKNRRWGAICCLAALAFPFAALALGGSVAGETTMWMLAYLFLGFLAAYRTLVFADISGKTALPALSALGLMAARLGEATGTLGVSFLTGTPLIVAAAIVFALVIAFFFPLYQKLYASPVSPEEMERQRFIEYVSRFGLSAREQEIFALILPGMSNAEIAGALYITESTVKFHAGNIFKKTGLSSRSELIADYKLGNKI
ncbi:MAG: LuxR C-terminal-related transcriptional regulator [Clostridiaceae bacterium]|nr:LuxR C-terminal-related transcriptional regulator [Eubacteriales bacterium]